MAKPPPLDRRSYPRVDLIAQVELVHSGEVEMFRCTNASMNGLFLAADPHEHPHLEGGAKLDLALMPEDDLVGEPIRLKATVMRIVEGGHGVVGGFGVAISAVAPSSQDRFVRLLQRAKT
jgi:hypothetical protein